MESDPANVIALLNRGVLYEKMEQIDNAEADFQKALNTGSRNPFVSQKAKQYGLEVKRPDRIPGTQIAYELPDTFKLAFEDSRNGTAIYQYVPKGEKLTDWSEMIMITSSAVAAPTESIANKTLDATLKGYSKICYRAKEFL